MRSWLLLGLGMLLGACHLEVSFADSHFYCGGGGSCPSGQTCVQEYCVASEPPDAAEDDPADAALESIDAAPGTPDAAPGTPDAAPGTPDARPGPPDAAPPPPDAALPPDAMPVCLLGNVADDFANGVAAPFWVPFSELPTQVAETGGRLVVTLQAGTSGSHFAGYVYLTNTDGRGQHIQVEIPVPPNPQGAADAFFKVQNGSNYNNEATFILENGVLYMDTYDANYNRLSRKQITFSATNHRFWALEENAGKVLFLTSPDGSSWTVRDQETAPFPFENARVALGGGTWRAESSPGGVQFDNLGMGPSTNCYGVPQ